MFSWLTKHCANSSSCQYQCALNNCTYPDWNTPPQNHMEYVIDCMRGKCPDVIRSQKAFSILRTNFEKHEQKNNSAFRLKNLLILDRCTEEMCILDMIANYEYNRLIYDRNKADMSVENKFLQKFICSYYLYIRKKADIYQRFPNELIDHKTRKFYLINAKNLGRIFQFIDFALQIQKLLNEASDALKNINKSPILIQEILTYMLKSYILLYTIVAISLQTLLSKLKSLKHSELNNLDRLLKYFSRDFSNIFLNFLEANKTIPAFKNIQYNQIIKIDPNYMQIFDKYYKLKVSEINANPEIGSQKTLGCSPTTASSSLTDSQQLQGNVLDIPEQVFCKLSELKFCHEPRNKICQIPSSDDHIFELNFIQYQNYYHESFKKDYASDATEQQGAQLSESATPKAKSRLHKKKSLMEDLINSKTLKRKSMKQRIPSKRFKEAQWITWQNIYSEE